MCSLGCLQQKTKKNYCPIIEWATHSTFQQHPSELKAAAMLNITHVVAGSCSSLMVQKSCWKMLQRRNRKWCLKIKISSWFRTVRDIKLIVEPIGNWPWAPFFSCHIQCTQPFVSMLPAWPISPCTSIGLLVVSEYQLLTLLTWQKERLLLVPLLLHVYSQILGHPPYDASVHFCLSCFLMPALSWHRTHLFCESMLLPLLQFVTTLMASLRLMKLK